jgi:hypothetical protein
MFRKVSCWPAKEASGRSSAVAEERTAKVACALPALSTAKASRIAVSRAAGNGCASTQARICAPASRQGAHVLGVERVQTGVDAVRQAVVLAGIRERRGPWWRNPVGTFTPEGSWEIISPRLAFLPPTASTSLILRFSNGTTRSVGLKSADMGKLQK